MSTTPYRHAAVTPAITEDLTPGSDEWARYPTASKVPAILGLSKYASAYSLWAQATGRVPMEEPDTAARKRYDRGHRLEPLLLSYLADMLAERGEDARVRPGATVRHPVHVSHHANPDGWVFEGRRRTPWAAVEAKTSLWGTDWGKEWTAEIPPAYLGQVAWQMHVTGLSVVYVPALVEMEFRVYVVTREDVEEVLPDVVAAVSAWEAAVVTDTPPALDGTPETLKTVRALHPQIDPDGVAIVQDDLLASLREAKAARAATDEAVNLATARILDEAGDARTLTDAWGAKVGRRQAKGNGTPYLVISK